MPQIGNNNEPLSENANYVWTGTLWVPQKSNADGEIIVDTELTTYEDVNIKTYDGSTWGNQRKIAYVSGNFCYATNEQDIGVGLVTKTFTPTITDDYWICDNIAIFVNSSTISTIYVRLTNVSTVTLVHYVPPTLNQYITLPLNPITIFSGNYFSLVVLNAGATDDLYLEVQGRKFN